MSDVCRAAEGRVGIGQVVKEQCSGGWMQKGAKADILKIQCTLKISKPAESPLSMFKLVSDR